MQRLHRSCDILAWENDQVKLLYYLVDLFVDVFGITRPSEAARRQAALFISALLLLTIVLVAGAGLAVRALMK